MAATPYGAQSAQANASSLVLNVTTTKAGDLLVVYLSNGSVSSGSPTASTPGLVWKTRTDYQVSALNSELVCFYAVAGAAGTYAITLQVAAVYSLSAVAFAVTGFDLNTIWDAYQAVPQLLNLATPTQISGTASTTNPSDLLVNVVLVNGNVVLNNDTPDGYTALAQSSGASGVVTGVQTKSVSTPVTLDPVSQSWTGTHSALFLTDAIRSAGSQPQAQVPYPNAVGGVAFNASDGNVLTSSAINVPSGDSVYVLVAHSTAAGQHIVFIGDNAGNTYTNKVDVSWPAENLRFYVYVCDNAVGNAALQVTIHTVLGCLGDMAVLDINTYLAGGSFDGNGPATDVTDGFVAPGTVIQDSATFVPTYLNDLLIGAMLVVNTSTSAGEVWENRQPSGVLQQGAGSGAGTSVGMGVYAIPATTLATAVQMGVQISTADPTAHVWHLTIAFGIISKTPTHTLPKNGMVAPLLLVGRHRFPVLSSSDRVQADDSSHQT